MGCHTEMRTFRRPAISLAALAVATAVTPVAAIAQVSPLADPAMAVTPAEEPVAAPNAMAAATETPAGEIVVSGSRIRRAGFTAPTPVTSLGAEDLSKRAVTNVADALNEIPAFRATVSSQTNNFSSGGAAGPTGSNFADLRGLGTVRTLVLVNNRRHVPTSLTGEVDINLIPTLMIDRVDVVTGGASAAWGSDAVAGVVNMVLKNKYSGLEALVQSGISDRGDNQEYRLGLLGGFDFGGGRGHIVAGLDYVKSLGVGDLYTRPWGRREGGVVTNPTPGVNGLPARIIATGVHFSTLTRGGLIVSGPLRGTAFNPDGSTYQYNYGQVFGNSQIGGDGQGLTFFTRQRIRPPVERYTGLVHASFDVTDAITLFAEGSYGNSKAMTESGPQRDQGGIVIRADNAFIPAAVKARITALNLPTITLGRWEGDIGIVTSRSNVTTKRGVIGTDFELGGSWKGGAYYQYGRTDYLQRIDDSQIAANWTRAIDAVYRNGTSGAIVCRSTLTNPNDGCVPLNIFGENAFTPEAQAYVNGHAFYKLRTQQHVAALNVGGDLFSTWAGPVSLATGVEYREEKGIATVDALNLVNGYRTSNKGPGGGKINVKEAFAEIAVPLAKDAPFAKELELNAAGRITDYSLSGTVETWKAGLTYSPIDDIRFRATRSRDIRAPNLNDFFNGQNTVNSTVINPRNNVQAFVPVTTAGNTALKPEKADTFTGGVVLQPSFISGFRMSVDYYSIKIKDVITTLTGQQTVDRCQAGLTDFCQFITYNSANALTSIRAISLNLAKLEAEGVDIEAEYRHSLGFMPGSLTLRDLTTYTSKLIIDGVNRANQPGDGARGQAGTPRWTHNVTLTYDNGPLSLTTQLRYISGGKYNAALIGPDDPNYSPFLPNSINDNTVPAVAYINLSGRYTVKTDNGPEFQIFGAVNNLLDKQPPLVPASTQTNGSNPLIYDVIGRTYKIGVKVRI